MSNLPCKLWNDHSALFQACNMFFFIGKIWRSWIISWWLFPLLSVPLKSICLEMGLYLGFLFVKLPRSNKWLLRKQYIIVYHCLKKKCVCRLIAQHTAAHSLLNIKWLKACLWITKRQNIPLLIFFSHCLYTHASK